MKKTVNFQKNYIIRWILPLAAIIATTTLPMSQKIAYKAQQFIQRSLQPFNAKQALVNTATAANFGLASYSFFKKGYNDLKNYISDETNQIKALPNIPSYANDHIKDVLGEYTPKIRKIDPNSDAHFCIYKDKVLFIGPEELERHKWPTKTRPLSKITIPV